jgi:hypothetical protein
MVFYERKAPRLTLGSIIIIFSVSFGSELPSLRGRWKPSQADPMAALCSYLQRLATETDAVCSAAKVSAL